MEPQKSLADLYTALVEDLDAIIEQKVRHVLAEILPGVDNAMLLDVPEAAGRLRLSVSKTKKMIASGDLHVGANRFRRRLVSVTAMEAYLDSLETR